MPRNASTRNWFIGLKLLLFWHTRNEIRNSFFFYVWKKFANSWRNERRKIARFFAWSDRTITVNYFTTRYRSNLFLLGTMLRYDYEKKERNEKKLEKYFSTQRMKYQNVYQRRRKETIEETFENLLLHSPGLSPFVFSTFSSRYEKWQNHATIFPARPCWPIVVGTRIKPFRVQINSNVRKNSCLDLVPFSSMANLSFKTRADFPRVKWDNWDLRTQRTRERLVHLKSINSRWLAIEHR